MSEQGVLSIIERLTRIWQRVLQKSQIGPDENFFDLSSSDATADSVFNGIAEEFGREIPTSTLFYAPTISALAELMARPVLPQFSPFVPLRPGSDKSPILMGHGVGGRASFSRLAQHIDTDHAVYGIQAKGVDGLEVPLDRIEDMAQFYLDALPEIQTQEPYILIGYSFGGLIALEMAQRLASKGKRIALLVLIDTYPDPRYFPFPQRLQLIAKKIQGHLFTSTRSIVSSGLSFLGRGLGLGRNQGQENGRSVSAVPGRLSLAQTTARVRESDFRAMARYRPKFYQGKIKFVKPETNSYLPSDPDKLWRPLADGLEVETVPGDHLGMMGAHFEALATVLTRYVQESDLTTKLG